MNPQNRDLLLLTNKETLDPLELEHEIELIIDILHKVENDGAFCVANEIIDLNRYRVIHKTNIIMNMVREKTLKPFIFICNKN